MLKPPTPNVGDIPRSRRRERKLWHDSDFTPSLGRIGCPEQSICGGLRTEAGIFDCTAFCCGEQDDCDLVCRRNPNFTNRYREVQSFDLGKVPRTTPLVVPQLPGMAPLFYHGSSRTSAASSEAVALSLQQMYDKRSGVARYTSYGELCRAYGIKPGTNIILSGTDNDPPLERWWNMGESRRRAIIRTLREIGVVMVTTPNYSLFTNTPRWDDFHAMKRIAVTHHEFLMEGLPAALHVNGRTDKDFERWAEYIAGRPEISHIAYEFATGAGWTSRRNQHVQWLAAMAAAVGRPLDLIMRAGIEILPVLRKSFARVTYIDTNVFMKTVNRQKAMRIANGTINWISVPTAFGQPLDGLLDENLEVVKAQFADLAATDSV